MTVRKFKVTKAEKIVEELNSARGLNGVRKLIRKYLSRSFRMALVEKSPEFFLMYYLGFKLPPHQRKWITLWQIKYVLELAPRDHGKSWIFSYGLPLYEIYLSYIKSKLTSVDQRYLQISKTDEQAGKFAGQVKGTIEKNQWLMEDFGDIRDTTLWYKGMFRCKRSSTDALEKDPTYEKVGVLGAITGGHFHRIGGDDILDDENTKTADRMDGVENWFWGTVWNLRETYTRFTLVGTLKNRRDLYHTIMKTATWQVHKERAIIKYPMIPDESKPGSFKQGWQYLTDKGRRVTGLGDLKPEEKILDVELLTDDYKVLWPSSQAIDNDGNKVVDDHDKPVMFGWGVKELLMDRATQGETYFAREKQNEITSESGEIFKREWFRFFDTNEIYWNPQDNFFYLNPMEAAA